ncbi:MAG: hypothetical protein JO061_15365 [Acidobacteriaceae bacterium]|nr:hypothetical protein [Acidobacteriaceae bacterium]
MSQPRETALVLQTQPARTWTIGIFQAAGAGLGRVGVWAVDTAQEFGSVLSVLMGPAVFLAYAFASWSLAANLGWTATFPYSAGPLSNWLVWVSIAVLVHIASDVLRRCTHPEG